MPGAAWLADLEENNEDLREGIKRALERSRALFWLLSPLRLSTIPTTTSIASS
jgi:hypothetical protein